MDANRKIRIIDGDQVYYADEFGSGSCSKQHFCRVCIRESTDEDIRKAKEFQERYVLPYSPRLIRHYIPIYTTDEALYEFASRYWDGDFTAVSLSRALRLAMNQPNCPNSIDPFESLVDCWMYAKPAVCWQVWNEEKWIYEDSPEWIANHKN